jgi:hypothetical protein
MKKGQICTLHLDGRDVAAHFVNVVTDEHSLIRLMPEYRNSPTDAGLRTVEVKDLSW